MHRDLFVMRHISDHVSILLNENSNLLSSRENVKLNYQFSIILNPYNFVAKESQNLKWIEPVIE